MNLKLTVPLLFRVPKPTGSLELNIKDIEKTYIDEDLKKIEDQLNTAKSLLDKIPVDKFKKLSKILDFYRSLRFSISKKFNAQGVTNAWLKMWEISHTMHLHDVPSFKKRGTKDMYVFSNAELPGGFICAMNHFFTNKRINFHWRGSSLNPKKGSAIHDEFQLYAKNQSKWLFSDENDGDLTDPANIADITAQLKSQKFAPDIYTSDGGMDVSHDYNKQELINLPLHFGQIISGLSCLVEGGVFIVKQYTLFTPFNLSILMVLSHLFDELFIYKPFTSRPYNSEIYIVGYGYKPAGTNIISQLLNTLDSKTLKKTILVDIHSDKYKKVRDMHKSLCVQLFSGIQVKALEYKYDCYASYFPQNNIQKLEVMVQREKIKFQNAWFVSNALEVLSDDDKLTMHERI